MSEEMISRLAVELTDIVASALDVPENNEARLTADDIEVRVATSQKFDVNAKSLEILVLAHEYPERLQNLEDRKDRIVAGVRRVLNTNEIGVRGWVWVLLTPTAFGKFGDT